MCRSGWRVVVFDSKHPDVGRLLPPAAQNNHREESQLKKPLPSGSVRLSLAHKRVRLSEEKLNCGRQKEDEIMRTARMWPIIVLAVGLLVIPELVAADVVVKQKTSATMAGGVIKSSGTITTAISGDKQRSDSEMKTKLVIVSSTVKTTDIMRLDKELVWNLDNKKKTYTEMTFAEMRAMLDSLQAEMQKAGEESGKDDEDYEVSPPEFKVEKTGKTATIAGYSCGEYIMTVITRAKDKKTGDTGSFTLHNQMWMTTDWAGQAEYEAFAVKMAQKMGFGRGMESAQTYLAMMGVGAEDLSTEMGKIGGFPMKQEMTMYTFGAPAAQKEAGKEQSTDTAEESKSPTDNLAKLGGLFGKKKDKEKEEKSKDSAAGPGALFSMTIEVESLSSGSVDAGQFEIPTGYKKVEKKK
jgi:hypothetical protein